MPPTRERRWWTDEEDEILRSRVELQRDQNGSVKNWNEIAALLPGRTNKDCRKRWCKVRVDIRKGAWTRDEDERLHKAVEQLGFKWALVSKTVETRNADQCAKRWQHVLGPDFKHCPWTPEEDQKLLEAIKQYGNNWKQIGLSELPDRSSHDIRNRSVALSRRNQRSSALASKTAPSSIKENNGDIVMFTKSESEDDETDEEEEGDDEENDEYTEFDLHFAATSQSPLSSVVDMGMHSATEFDFAKDPEFAAMSHPFNEQSLGSNWDWADPNNFYQPIGQNQLPQHQQQATPPIEGLPDWYQNLSTETSRSGNFLIPSSTPEPYFDINSLDPSLLNMYAGHDQMMDTTGTPMGLTPPSSEATTPRCRDRKGSVTVILNQVDADLAQQIINGVLRHTANLSIRLQMN